MLKVLVLYVERSYPPEKRNIVCTLKKTVRLMGGLYPTPGVIRMRQIVCISALVAETLHSGGLEICGLNRERRK